MKTKIILLGRDCDSSRIVYNYLSQYVEIEFVIFEKTVSRKKKFFRRAKQLGFLRASGQVAFMGIVFPFIKLFSQKRKKEIFREYGLNETPLPAEKIIRIETLNSAESRKLLQQLSPDLLLVNGTRIISKKTLECVAAPFINIHVGITPLFRGVHGGYWTVATGRKELFGTTIHYVDSGVDTGGIIEQVFARPHKKDNFYTYPYLQYAISLPALKQIAETFTQGQKPGTKQPVTQKSALWFHPTVWQWLKNLKRTLLFIFICSAMQLFSELLCA